MVATRAVCAAALLATATAMPVAPGAKLGDVFMPPVAYTASLSFHIPYVPFTEPLTVAVDKNLGGGSMRLSYYAGLDTFIDSKSAASYKIVPVNDEMTCLNTTACSDKDGDPAECSDKGASVSPAWQHIFPNDLTLFNLRLDEANKQPATSTVQRCRRYKEQYGFEPTATGRGGAYTGKHVVRECAVPVGKPVEAHVWQFTTTPGGGVHVADIKNVCDTIDPRICEKWLGNYTFYTEENTDGTHTPIRFEFTGHNVVLGGSHFDQYVLDYNSVTPAGPEGLDPNLFQPPAGMECFDSSQPFGPTRQAATQGALEGESHPQTHPTAEIAMLFPGEQADQLRADTFAAYSTHHGKKYSGAGEQYVRGQEFHRALRHINAHNRQRKGYWLKATHFADWSEAERAAINGARWTDEKTNKYAAHAAKHPHKVLAPTEDKTAAPPASVDWRKAPAYTGATNKGAYTNQPKDQGTCGSCWSFGATGTIEGALARETTATQPFPTEVSQQNLLDCSWSFGNNACDGGLDWEGFEWMIKNNTGAIASAASYSPYMNQEGFCHFDKSAQKTQPVTLNGKVYKAEAVATITGWRSTSVFRQGNETDGKISTLKSLIVPVSQANLKDALFTRGPISVSIDATPPDFYYYGGGVFDNKACTGYDLDHSVLAVGYGEDVGKSYWIVKNSWSTYWGEEGFVRVAMDEDNICGVATTPNYVTGLTVAGQ